MTERCRLNQAERAYRGALRVDPDSRSAHKALADLAEDRGDDRGARVQLEWLAVLERPTPDILRRLSEVCERLGDDAAAIQAFRDLVLSNAGSREHLLAIADRMATSRIDGVRNVERGHELAQALVDGSGGQSPASLFVLSRAEAALGQSAAAARSLERAAELVDPRQPICSLLRLRAEQARQSE